MQNKYFCAINIANVNIVIHSQFPIKIFEKFKIFMSDNQEGDYNVFLHEVEELPHIDATLLKQGLSFDVYETESKEYIRYFRDAMTETEIYAIGRYDWKHKEVEIQYLSQKRAIFSQLDNCLFHMAWETLLLQENRLLLHSSCIDTDIGGVLFSGPSGIGKSTQAKLWCDYKNAKLLNGDRPILCKENGVWKAYGSPYAGSSNCHINEKCVIHAIMMLEQANQSQIKKLDLINAFRKVFAEITVNSWDRCSVNKVTDLVLSLIKEIPVYQYQCTADYETVDFLYNKLTEGI